MAKINKIRLSGTTYDIEDLGAAGVIELTQAQYDALAAKDPDKLYVITDATPIDTSDLLQESAFTAYTASTEDKIASKLDASAYTPTDLSGYYTRQETDNAITAATNGLASQSWVEGKGYLTQHQSLENYALKSEIPSLNGYATQSWVEGKNYLTEHQDISGKLDVSAFNTYSGTVDTSLSSKASESDLNALSGTVTAHTADTSVHVTSAEKNAWNAKSDFSGSYDDLTDKPAIPTVPTSNTAFTNDAGYITSDAITGKVDTTAYDTYTAATNTALSGKQDTLVSGTNIKTINNKSLLGSGNITIEGGISSTAVENAFGKDGNVVIPNASWNGHNFIDKTMNAFAIDDYTNIKPMEFVIGYFDDSIWFSDGEGRINVTLLNYDTNTLAANGQLRYDIASDTFSLYGFYKPDLFNSNVTYSADTVNKMINIKVNYDEEMGMSDYYLRCWVDGGWDNTLISYPNADGQRGVLNYAVFSNGTKLATLPMAYNGYILGKYNLSKIQEINAKLEDGGSDITVDSALDSGSTNPVANSAITAAIDGRQIAYSGGYFYDAFSSYQASAGITDYLAFRIMKNDGTTSVLQKIYYPRINGKRIIQNAIPYYYDFSLVETSAITTSITSSSTDAQVPSAKAVNDQLGGLKLVKLTQAEYDALASKDSNTLFVISG